MLLSCSSSPHISFDSASFSLELAITPEQKQQGLMFRESLPKDAGMLFVFNDTEPRGFWMKNTKIPLDMIYLDENLTVVEIKKNIRPCLEDPCAVYKSKPAKYVLEVNAGESVKIKEGSQAVLT